ncbi:hypothetical protein J2S31_000656 [Nitrospina gracilis Nb-211]|nr:hypothetical protein [Nitrospina gracilis Nb-211]
MGEDVELGPQTIAWKERVTLFRVGVGCRQGRRPYICER